MARRDHLCSVRAAIGASLLAGALVGNSWAARDFTPQAGTWGITEELDGNPGRGLAIDVQGNTFAMQVFGYEKNGDATFYLATGQMDGDSVTAPLMRYQGGRSYGSPARDGVEAGSAGNVTVRFSDALHGTIQFPGEKAVAMERYLVRSSRLPLNPEAEPYALGGYMQLAVVGADGQLVDAWRARLSFFPPTQKWRLTMSSLRSPSKLQYMDCSLDGGSEEMACVPQSPSDIPAANQLGVRSLSLRIVGPDVQGAASLESAPGQILRVAGARLDVGMMGAGIPECMPYTQSYTYGGCTKQRIPVNGAWIASDELTGRPGRGLALDVQYGVVIVQSFDYLADGRASFAMGVGTLTEGTTDVQVPLARYAGGRYLGGPGQSASLQAQVGDLVLGFYTTDANGARSSNQSKGTVQYPGEAPKPVVRFNFQSDPASPEQLLGQWVLALLSVSSEQSSAMAQAVILERVVDGAAQTADGAIACTPALEGDNTIVRCSGAVVQAGQSIPVRTQFYLRNGEPSTGALRLRDRFGNWLGLGLRPIP